MAVLLLLCLSTISLALQTGAEQSIKGVSSSKCLHTCCANGIPGIPGHQGQPGVKGEKGDSYDPASIPKSAFTAVNTGDKAVKVGDILSGWSEVVTNQGGDFDPTTGKFTCRIPGTYSFTFSCTKWVGPDGPVCHLSSNKREVVVGAYVGYEAHYHLVTNGATLDLARGDQVYVKIGHKPGTVVSNVWRFTAFSGFILFPF